MQKAYICQMKSFNMRGKSQWRCNCHGSVFQIYEPQGIKEKTLEYNQQDEKKY